MRIDAGAVFPRDVLRSAIRAGLRPDVVLTRSTKGNRLTRKTGRDRRLMWLQRQRRARLLREGMLAKIKIESEPYGRSFRRANLYSAARILGLRLPIRIEVSTEQREHGVADSAAGYRFRDGTHLIRLDDRDDVTAADLSLSLWHELVHALDAEEDPDWRNKYIAETQAHGYDGNAYELVARELAADLAPGLPLVRG